MCGHRLPPGGIFPLHGLVQSPASSGYEEKSAGISRSSAWFKTGSSLASRLLGDHGWVAQEPCGGLRPSPLSSHLSTHREQFLPPNPTHQPRTSRTDMQYSGGLGYQPSGSLLGPRLNEKRPPRVTGRTLACHELGLYSVGGGQRKGGGVTLGPCPRVWVFFFSGRKRGRRKHAIPSFPAGTVPCRGAALPSWSPHHVRAGIEPRSPLHRPSDPENGLSARWCVKERTGKLFPKRFFFSCLFF